MQFVRAQSFFGLSFVYVIFDDGTDMYWARSRVLEYMQSILGSLPEGVTPRLGPDATGVGWVYQYVLLDETGQHNLQELRSFQDWYLRYWLQGVAGVAEVATVGGYVNCTIRATLVLSASQHCRDVTVTCPLTLLSPCC